MVVKPTNGEKDGFYWAMRRYLNRFFARRGRDRATMRAAARR
jgi:hypothetical protein